MSVSWHVRVGVRVRLCVRRRVGGSVFVAVSLAFIVSHSVSGSMFLFLFVSVFRPGRDMVSVSVISK